MKGNKKQMQILSLCISMVMLILSACGKTEEPVEVMADEAEVEVEAEPEIEDPTAIEEKGEEEGKEEEAEAEKTEEIEEPLAMVPYYEENNLEFCKDLVISTQAVRTNINDESDMEVTDAEWTLESISIENGEEEGSQVITIKSICTSYYWTDRKDRQMYSVVLPIVRYCDLNTGECYPNLNKTGDMELGYLVDVEWDKIFEIDYSGSSEWNDDGDWTSDKESGGYIHPTTVHYEDKFVIKPHGYDSLGMIIVPLAISDMEDREDGVQEDDVLIKDVLEEREGCYLYSVMDMYEMLNEDSVDGDKGNASTNIETQKDSTTTNNSSTTPKPNTSTNSGGSKENTTPKQEQQTHTHSYTSSVTKNPTCTEEGVRTYTCTSCKDSYTESIPATGHQWTTSTQTISHPSTGHYETVTKKEAFCGCGASGFQSQEELNAHLEAGCPSQSGGIREWSEEIWVVDTEPWEETITVTKCAVCGAQG